MTIENKFGAAFGELGCRMCQQEMHQAVLEYAENLFVVFVDLVCLSHGANPVLVVCSADPFLNDETFLTSVLALEELGATGNKVRRRTTK